VGSSDAPHGPSDTPRFVLKPARPVPGGVFGRLARIAHLAIRVARLGARPTDRVRLFAAPFQLVAANRLGRRAEVRLSIRAFGRDASCTISHFAHVDGLAAIFLDGDYALEPRQDPQVIVDLGSNIGLSILYFRLRYPGARILGVEPDPGAFALLERNVADLAGVTILHAAVSDRDETVLLWSVPGAAASALEHTHAAQQPVEVPARTLQDVLASTGIEHVDILKLVVEGSEFRALKSLDDLGRVDAITGEIVFVDGDPERSPEALRELLADYELSLFEDKGDGFWQFHAWRRAR
jgi:FkbM family methyltransferase